MDDGDALVSVEVVAAPTVGRLELDSATVTANKVVTKTQLDDGELVFTPVANANGGVRELHVQGERRDAGEHGDVHDHASTSRR